MNNKTLHLNDDFKDDLNDIKEIRRKSKTTFPTQVIFKNQLGEVLFEEENMLIMGGRRFVLEKLFNINSAMEQRLTLNNILSFADTDSFPAHTGPRQIKHVCLFGVGTGGSDLLFGSVKAPNARNNNLYGQIPFRIVDEGSELDPLDEKYFGKVVSGGKVSYYLKAFEVTPQLYMRTGDETFTPVITDNDIVDNEGNPIDYEDVEIFVELSLKINLEDIREHFIATEGLDKTRINELGLFYGYQETHTPGTYEEYKGVECFSKLTFNNEGLDSETKEINIVYRIYT